MFSSNYTSFIYPFKSRGFKIFYAIQATGNGHIARAIELVPYLQQYGEVDVFLSGSNSNLQFDLPVKYRSKGVSLFYGNHGGLNYWKMLKEFSIKRIWKEAKDLPVEKYDIVINDFECITSIACKIKNVTGINFGHQASFQSNKTPRPERKDLMGELILKKYAVAKTYVGLHFEPYDDFIFNPVIKADILKAEPSDKGYITVYLSHYSDEVIADYLKKFKDIRFEIFSKKVKTKTVIDNISFIPINNKDFTKSLTHCHGIITVAGFETPAEALYLGKKILCLPIKGQYEQLCNAEALKKFHVPVIHTINDNFNTAIQTWLNTTQMQLFKLSHSTFDIVQYVMKTATALKEENNAIHSFAENKNMNHESLLELH